MPKANKKEATIATQRREHLQFTSFHKPSSPFVAIITSKPQQQRNSIHSNPTNHRHSFIILDDDLTLPLHTVIWAKQHGKIFKHHCRPGVSAFQARLFILARYYIFQGSLLYILLIILLVYTTCFCQIYFAVGFV